MSEAEESHAVATTAVKAFFAEAKDRRLDAGAMLVALETFLTISVIYIGHEVKTPSIRAYAQEILDAMTDRAMARVNDQMIDGVQL